MATQAEIIEVLKQRFGDIDFKPAPLLTRGAQSGRQMYVRVPADRLVPVLTFLRDDPRSKRRVSSTAMTERRDGRGGMDYRVVSTT